MALTALNPLPQPGLPLFQGFTAQKLENFHVKADKKHSSRYSVTFMSGSGVPGAPLLKIDEEEKRVMVFRLVDGREVMRIQKKEHKWTGRDPEYYAHAPDGSTLWHLFLHRGMFRTDYRLKLDPRAGGNPPSVAVEKMAQGKDQLGIVVNGSLATIMTKPNIWKLAKENTVQVAPGMDILLALGVNWIRYDKQDMDIKTIEEAASAVGG